MGLKLLSLTFYLTLATAAVAEEYWARDQHQILASTNDQSSIGRLEIMASENCAAIELRLWMEISKIEKLAQNDDRILALSFLLADMQIATAGHLLETYQGVGSNTNLAYIRLGYWAWDVINYLPKNSDGTHFSLVTDGYEVASNNTWPVGNLSDQLRHLKTDCDSDLLGTML